MFEGRIVKWDRVELKVDSTVTKSLPSGPYIVISAQHSAALRLWNAPSYGSPLGGESEVWFDEDPFSAWNIFVNMTVNANIDDTVDVSGYTLDIPSLGISEVGTPDTYSDSVNASLEIDDYCLYVHTSGVWRLRFSEMRFYFNGSLINTYSGATGNAISVLNPWDMPFLSLYPQMLGDLAASGGQGFPPTGSPFGGVPDDWDISSTLEQSITGGIRFKEGGSWYTLPVSHLSPIMPTLSGGCEDPSFSAILADTTWTTEIQQYYEFREVGAFCLEGIGPLGQATVTLNTWIELTIKKASCWLWPDLTRQVNRATGDDYKALWFRWGFPWVKGRGQKTYTNYSGPVPELPPEDEGDESLETEIYPEHSSILSTVGNTSHVIEDPLGETLYMPAKFLSSFTRAEPAPDSRNYTSEGGDLPPACPNPAFNPPDACNAQNTWEWPYSVEKVADSGGQIPNVHKHKHPYVRLWSTWWNPHWNYSLWFPPDDAEDSVQWQIDGDPAAAKFYWLLIAQQHLKHSALPEGEDTGTRNFVLDAPLDFSGLRDLIESTYFGQWTSWLGISRFERIKPTIPTELQLDSESEDAWSSEDGTFAFGSQIVFTPSGSGEGTVVIKLDTGRFMDSAYQFPHLCKSVFLEWVATNINEVRVYLESYSGDRHILEAAPGNGFTTNNQAYSFGTWTDSKYGGSWGQDFGAGFLVDEGNDELLNGVSPALMADNERLYSLGLLTLRHGVKLRFEIDVEDQENPITLEYPIWQRQEEDPGQIVETASTSDLLFPSGPGQRFGQWSFWNYLSDMFSPSPTIRFPGNRMSALDALCLKRTVFEGIAPDDGLDAEIAGIYENGVEYTLRAHLARDPIEERQTTLGMLWHSETSPVLLFAISSLREPPPLAGFPFKSRDADWNPSGDHAQISYSFCVEPRRYVKQGSVTLDLDDGAGNVWTAAETSPTGWAVSKHSHPVDGFEALFKLLVGARWIASARPWHGYFGTTADITGQGANPWNLMSTVGQYHRANIEEGDVWYRRARFSAPFGGFEQESQITESGDCSHPRMAEDGRPGLYVVYITEASGLCIRVSHDEGTSFGGESVLISGAYFGTIAKDPVGTLIALGFVYNSGTSGPGKIKMRRKGPGDASWSAAVNIQSGGNDMEFEPDTFHISYDLQGPGRWVLVCKISGETDLSEWYSTDECETFKEVT